ncbi:putative mitochondrial protein [Cucumis melo var. makuwa]|uniref:Putative mitochondrial protein n=1 Tax=Cucumis melo var. makuwa TaxID=1194695 RepID=A0A5D3C2T4_CUCMM|nr:putative mitochondrial protein [Cucumis melo var. makuwa]
MGSNDNAMGYVDPDDEANFAAENEASENAGAGESKLFMVNVPSDQKAAEVWFIDSGYSNHMTGLKPIFKELNEGEKLKVKLRNDNELQVEGKDTVGIETRHGKRVLTNVQYVPDIGYNLLSVGQLMDSVHSILFNDDAYLIKDKQTRRVMGKVKMTQRKMFPLEVTNMKNFTLIATATATTICTAKNDWSYDIYENKSETFEKFKHFKAKVEKQSGMELTMSYTPEKNGVVERKNWIVVEMARNMLQVVMNKTPFEAWCSKKPNTKFAVDGSLKKHKAQLVAKGYAQQHEVYVGQPKGFVKEGSEEKVYKLTKALYRLNQALRAWYSKIDSSSKSFVTKFKSHMKNEFEMMDLVITSMNLNEKLQQNDGAEMADPQFMQRPSRDHFGAAMWVMHYIARTMEYGIWRSVSANVFTLGSRVITWNSKKQAMVALSSQ